MYLQTISSQAYRQACQRRSPRVPLGVEGRLWHDNGWQQVRCEDLSRDGVGLTVLRPELGEMMAFTALPRRAVRVVFDLPEGPVEVAGRIAHRTTGRVGIRFQAVGSQSQALINRRVTAG